MRQLIKRSLQAVGYDVVRHDTQPEVTTAQGFPADASLKDREILTKISGYTMTSIERQLAVINAVRHIVQHNIQGCVVECGVWRGGSSMAAALTLLQEGDTKRDLHLFDTFEGMSAPKDIDKSIDGISAQSQMEEDADKTGVVWAVASLDDVQSNMKYTGYPAQRIKYAKGMVESTIPSQIPDEPIALLRLDTDWYESTKHELIHLFPLLTQGGVLIIDDYGHWEGAKKAVDEYFAAINQPFYLHRVDYTGRMLIKHWAN